MKRTLIMMVVISFLITTGCVTMGAGKPNTPTMSIFTPAKKPITIDTEDIHVEGFYKVVWYDENENSATSTFDPKVDLIFPRDKYNTFGFDGTFTKVSNKKVSVYIQVLLDGTTEEKDFYAGDLFITPFNPISVWFPEIILRELPLGVSGEMWIQFRYAGKSAVNPETRHFRFTIN